MNHSACSKHRSSGHGRIPGCCWIRNQGPTPALLSLSVQDFMEFDNNFKHKCLSLQATGQFGECRCVYAY